MQRALDFKDKNDITGWNITGVSSKYEIFKGGTHHQASKYYQKLWNFHNYLVRKWKDQSPKKFKE